MFVKNLLRKILLSCLNKLDDKNHHSLEQRLQRLEQVIEVTKYPQELSYIDNFKPSTAYKFCDWFVNLFRKPGRKEENSHVWGGFLYTVIFSIFFCTLFILYKNNINYIWCIIINICNFLGKHVIIILITLVSVSIISNISSIRREIYSNINELKSKFTTLTLIATCACASYSFLLSVTYKIFNILTEHDKLIHDGSQTFQAEQYVHIVLLILIPFSIIALTISSKIIINIMSQRDAIWASYNPNAISIFKIFMLYGAIIASIYIDNIDTNTLRKLKNVKKMRECFNEVYTTGFFIFYYIIIIVELIWARYEIDKAILKRINKE